MTAKLVFFARWYLIWVAMFLMISRPAHGQGNFVVNGGFDADASGWGTNSTSGYWEPLKGHPAGCFTLYGSINQTVNGLTPGEDYFVSGSLEIEGGALVATPSFGVTINGILLYEAAPADYEWHDFSFNYTPSTSSVFLNLAAQINGTSDVYRIDDISIAIPEPSALALIFLAGGVLVSLAVRRLRVNKNESGK